MTKRVPCDPGLLILRQIRDVTIIELELPDTIPSIPVVPELVICQECAGTGELDDIDGTDEEVVYDMIECPHCDGRGVVPRGPEPDDEE